MSDIEKFLELLDVIEKRNLKLSGRISALQSLTMLLALQTPKPDLLIAALQVNLESIEQDDSQTDYAAALRALIKPLTEQLHGLNPNP